MCSLRREEIKPQFSEYILSLDALLLCASLDALLLCSFLDVLVVARQQSKFFNAWNI